MLVSPVSIIITSLELLALRLLRVKLNHRVKNVEAVGTRHEELATEVLSKTKPAQVYCG